MIINELDTIRAQAEQLYNRNDIDNAILKQAEEINLFLSELSRDDLPPLFLPVMNGGLIYAGQLLPLINIPVQVDYIHATRYRNTTQGFELEWKVYPQHELKDRVVIVLDDILDEGYTLDAIVNYCKQQQVVAVKSSVLVTKTHQRRDTYITADFSAMTVPDKYVFGFGMDYQGQLRNLDAIYALK